MVDEAAFRELMGRVCAPVTVVTTVAEDGSPYGTTVSSFASLSLQPPMVTFALGRESTLLRHVQAARRVGVNVLADGQDHVATAFAGRHGNKFDGVSWREDAGLPRLDGAGAWLVGRATQLIDGGDHVLVLAEVLASDVADLAPLVYVRRTFGTHSKYQQRAELPS